LTAENPGDIFPAVVMTNSWAIATDLEYLAVQSQWAREGYVVLSYEARGWLGSGGMIGTAGPDDIKDASAVRFHSRVVRTAPTFPGCRLGGLGWTRWSTLFALLAALASGRRS
jgi:hypothetical protein